MRGLHWTLLRLRQLACFAIARVIRDRHCGEQSDDECSSLIEGQVMTEMRGFMRVLSLFVENSRERKDNSSMDAKLTIKV